MIFIKAKYWSPNNYLMVSQSLSCLLKFFFELRKFTCSSGTIFHRQNFRREKIFAGENFVSWQKNSSLFSDELTVLWPMAFQFHSSCLSRYLREQVMSIPKLHPYKNVERRMKGWNAKKCQSQNISNLRVDPDSSTEFRKRICKDSFRENVNKTA